MNSESLDPREPATGDPAEGGASTPGLSAEEQLAKAKEEAQKFRDNWHRAEADFQNYKRRTEQEREELRRFGNVSIIINLLPVLDDFERAFASLDSHLAGLSWFDGMLLIYRKLRQLLENAGVKPIETEGQAFDPRFHEAVAHVEGEEGKVKGKPQEPGAGSREPEERKTEEEQSQ